VRRVWYIKLLISGIIAEIMELFILIMAIVIIMTLAVLAILIVIATVLGLTQVVGLLTALVARLIK
jgi:hypothetical protein